MEYCSDRVNHSRECRSTALQPCAGRPYSWGSLLGILNRLMCGCSRPSHSIGSISLRRLYCILQCVFYLLEFPTAVQAILMTSCNPIISLFDLMASHLTSWPTFTLSKLQQCITPSIADKWIDNETQWNQVSHALTFGLERPPLERVLVVFSTQSELNPPPVLHYLLACIV